MGAILNLKADNFVEDMTVRDKYISRVDVLERVKTLSLLPDGEHMTVRMVADYYNVEYAVLGNLLTRYKKEFQNDGVHTITSKDKAFNKLTKALPSKQFIIKLIPRRSILRMGMLLRDSEVAKEVRTYLLNVEKESTQEIKDKVTETWTKSEIVTLNKILNNEANAGTNIMAAVRIGAKELNRPSNNVYQKLHNINRKYGSLNKYIVENNLVYMNEESKKASEQIDTSQGVTNDQLSSVTDKLIAIENQLNAVSDLNSRIHSLEKDINENTALINTQKELLLRKSKLIDKYKNENSSLRADFIAIKKIMFKDVSGIGTKTTVVEESNKGKEYTRDGFGNIEVK